MRRQYGAQSSCQSSTPRPQASAELRLGAEPGAETKTKDVANPPAAVTRSDALRGNVVRLECPHELPERDWDGPICTRLREACHIQPGHSSPFVIDDSSRRPGWVRDLIHRRYDPNESTVPSTDDTDAGFVNVVIPFSRLTRTSGYLSMELRDRPFLVLSRFVRFRTCFVADCDGSDPNRFIEATQAVYLVDQVVAYRTCNRLSFVTPSGVALRPTSNYMCVVAVRQPESNTRTHVLLPAQDARDSLISRREYAVGWCHGARSSSHPNRRTARFRSRWAEFIRPSANDSNLQRLLRDAFVPRGSDTTVDFGTVAIPLVTEFGRVISITPLEYARTYVGPTGSTSGVDADADSDSESSIDILAVGMSRGRPLPHDLPTVVSLDTPLRLCLPNEENWITSETRGSTQQQEVSSGEPSASHTTMCPGPSSTDTIPRAPSASLASPVTSAPGTSDAVVATLMSLAQATQQLVATTQQLVREQREHQQAAMARSDTPPASRPNVTIDTTEVPTTREGTPLSSGRSSNSGRSKILAHAGSTANYHGDGVGAGAPPDITPVATEAEVEAANPFLRKDGRTDSPAAIDCHENPHRATLLGAQGVTPITLMTEIVTTTPAIVIAPEANTVTETDNPGMAGMRRIATTGSLSVLPDMSS
ncbi:hypothetical protein L915_18782 [Phytophthora nicotianae]|uniref:Uncharacterized protein n=1 Tax=Phytophthora nicotianae TaxID=4792 RepID=W2FUJ9_PHYNI|nr:hypothetical protein L915_18782 [Phytophthora nicotianae]